MFFKTIREITIKNHRQYFQIGVCHIIKNCHLFQDDSIILQQMIRKSIGCGISAYL
jgi:hypothetical protein